MWLNDTRLSIINEAILPTIGLTMDIKLYVRTGDATGAYTLFYTKYVDVCTLLKNPMSDLLTNLVLQAVAKNKNNHVILNCPIALVSFLFQELFVEFRTDL